MSDKFMAVKSDFFDGYVPVTKESLLGLLNPTRKSETIKAMEAVIKAKEAKRGYKIKESLSSSDFLATALVTQRELDMTAPYPENDPTFDITKITQLKKVNDFSTVELYRTTETEDLNEVASGADYESTSFEDAKDTAAIKKYGRIITITMEAAKNDILGIFAGLPEALNRSAQRTKAKQITNLFAGNATFFNAGNSNILTGAPLNQANLEAAISLMANQTDDNGNRLAIKAATLVVPTSLGFSAKKLVEPILAQIAAGSMDTGVTAFDIDLVVSPWLEDVSSVNWYLFADPNIYPAITRLEMNGIPGPQLFIKQSDAIALANAGGSVMESFHSDKISWKVRLLHNAVMRRPQAAVYATKL